MDEAKKSFIKQTADDYDVSFENAVRIYEADDPRNFYNNMEIYIRERRDFFKLNKIKK